MDYDNLKSLIATAPVIKLLRAKKAPLILSFLHREFKANNKIVIPQFELQVQLTDYLEFLGDEDLIDDSQYSFSEQADRLLNKWCDEDHLYLRRYLNDVGEAVLELTTYTERAFQWVGSLQKREFVGAESRFRNIVTQLHEIIENTAEDPERKLRELELKKKEINQEIKRIKKTGKIESFSDTQIKERFFNLSRTSRELIADFKEVEQNFREISLNIYKKQASRQVGKGKILSYTLDATDELKNSDQGKSFYAFWQFLIADSRQDELLGMIDNVYAILQEREVEQADSFLKKIKFHLHNAGKKVIDSNHKIAEKLSRTLAEQNLAERKKTRELISEIKNMAVEQVSKFQGKRSFIEIEGWPVVKMVMDRPLGERTQVANFENQPLPKPENENVDLSIIFEQFEMNRRELETRIEELLRQYPEISLLKVIEFFPLQKGLAEIIAYLSIASGHEQHRIDQSRKIPVSWEEQALHKTVMMPAVTYFRKIQNGKNGIH